MLLASVSDKLGSCAEAWREAKVCGCCFPFRVLVRPLHPAA